MQRNWVNKMNKVNAFENTIEKVIAKNRVVATSEPHASIAGMDILKKGGNAVDAAIAIAACLTVVEPTSNGIGGDNFAIVWINQKLHGMNASGPSPAKLTREKLISLGHDEIPKHGVIPITVPGGVKGWASLHQKFGKLPFKTCLEPAIKLAKEGFHVSKTVAKYWEIAHQIYSKNLISQVFNPWFNTFSFDGKAPIEGQFIKLEDHAKTLELIADTYGESFYKGIIAKKIVDYIEAHHGLMALSDLENYDVEWVEPISIKYHGYDVYELPPNGQGLVLLEALGLYKETKSSNDFEHFHHQIESLKLAFADGFEYIADRKYMQTDINSLLNENYLKTRAKEIKDYAIEPRAGKPNRGGTVYFATADQDGNMVSMIQSNYMGFGSGIVIPNTGIAMHNRGHNFNLINDHPNCIGPNKKPYHTIIPGFLMKENLPIGPFGVMGGFMQPQGHMQVIIHMLNHGMHPQDALNQPRWQWIERNKLLVESDFSINLFNYLKEKGHDISYTNDVGSFGRGQIILYDKNKKIYRVGTEKRCDGTIVYE
jgi:gamma-glutamyltranspeptidase / glutathione hydrolase